ncbi:MAG: DNA phosphorothioation system sulfurtransferase DndC, partial [Bacteroidales bacterium]|nr:DNA phosphorothioation system sulfurtransferase DndC [Bacteroidales bacterium]
LVWNSLLKIKEPKIREVHVVSNNTLVENPIIENYLNDILFKIQKTAQIQGLPIFVHKSVPKLVDTFWVKLLGLGYPAPNNQFRWCTERLKIDPTSNYIKDTVAENGEVIVLLGTRIDESANRAKTIKNHEIKGSRLTDHPSLKNAFIYLPIKGLSLEEVWGYINNVKPPWDKDNKTLFNLYANASADDYECPTLVVNKNAPSCGQSRFGCWTCTVVKEDKSTSALIKNGYEWLKPLLDYRNWLNEERNKPENRKNQRRNGQFLENGGPYEAHYRAKALEKLLIAQKEIQETQPYLELISHQELVAIQLIWYNDDIYNYNVSEIYNKIFEKNFNMNKNSEIIEKEKDLLKEVCNEEPEHFDLIEDLLKIQKTKDLLRNKVGLKSGIEKRIEEFLTTSKNED